MADVLSEEQIVEFKEAFCLFDKDGDGEFSAISLVDELQRNFCGNSLQEEELQLALFQTPHGENLFLDRVFDLVDEKRNGVVDFDEFVHALGIFHSCAPIRRKNRL
ncbi:calcineurin B-like protein 9 [Humulus lupulus]|uniref:calcineurin B-like protein 9 n=1 Tax=Humulus lupulus TaxID=3486 RepID=UPI002B407550|nr:calcineurin B-like protein 9 [Humulus lupulus]XP_062074835.1 calcineurin B-like protein 9 [Humulus lupulus]